MGAGAVAAATIGSAVIGAGTSLLGGSKSSGGASQAAQLQEQQYQQTRADLSPFTGAGAGVLPALNALSMSGPTGGGPDYLAQAAGERPLQMTQAELEATPGYQFTRDQGLKATQSAAAARGLGVSGASLKGAATYATNLANTTYKDQFNLQQQRFTDLLNMNTGQIAQLAGQYGRLRDTATLGANAAAGLGTQGTNAANAAGGYINAAGVDQSNALSNATNALSGGVNNYLGYNARQNALNPNGSAPAGYVPASFADPNTGYTTGGFSGGNVPILPPGYA